MPRAFRVETVTADAAGAQQADQGGQADRAVLDALADRPMQDIVKTLPLSEDTAEALVDRTGVKGQVLESAIAYERAEWERLPDVGIDARSLSLAYLEAIDWSSSMLELARA